MIRITALLISTLIFLSACGGTPPEVSDKTFKDNRTRVVVNDLVFYVWPTSRKDFVRVERSETEAVWATPQIDDVLDYQDKFLAEAARIVTGCDIDLNASKSTERTCFLCTPEFYAMLICTAGN